MMVAAMRMAVVYRRDNRVTVFAPDVEVRKRRLQDEQSARQDESQQLTATVQHGGFPAPGILARIRIPVNVSQTINTDVGVAGVLREQNPALVVLKAEFF